MQLYVWKKLHLAECLDAIATPGGKGGVVEGGNVYSSSWTEGKREQIPSLATLLFTIIHGL